MTEVKPLNPLAQVQSALKTDVVDILRQCVDKLSGLGRQDAYEAVLNEPELLHQSFTLLRREPLLFAQVLVDPTGQSVAPRDDAELQCGETLGRVKTLLVRASARRHFRRRLGGARTVMVRSKRKVGAVRLTLEWLGLRAPPPPKRRRLPGKGDELYMALRDYLVYDWQARLIPHYVAMTPQLVYEIGAALFKVREPAELIALYSDESRATFAQNRQPLLLSAAQQLMHSSGNGLDADLLWKLWDQMDMSRLFDNPPITEARRIIAEVAGTSKQAIRQLMPIIGSDCRQFISFLFVAYRELGRVDYRNIFSESGTTPWMSKVIADRLTLLPGLPEPDFEEMKQVYGQLLVTTAKTA